MPKMYVAVDIDVEKLSRDDLRVLRGEIEREVALREIMKTDTPKFRAMYYMGILERFGRYRAILRYMDDEKCGLDIAKKYIDGFVPCQTCHKFGGYTRSCRVGNLLVGGWVCPYCGIPPLPDGAVEVFE